MFFLRIAQVPVEVTFGDKTLKLPKFTLDDAVEWGSEIVRERDERDTAELDPEAKAQFLRFHPSIPPDVSELRQLLKAPDGVKRVISVSFKKVGVAEDEINQMIKSNGITRLAPLAFELADLNDSVYTDPNQKAANQTNGQTSQAGGSTQLPETGQMTSQSGSLPTPESDQAA